MNILAMDLPGCSPFLSALWLTLMPSSVELED
jgi:hypothetical protein